MRPQAYLFECYDDEELRAVTLDETGDSLPRRKCPRGWQLIQSFCLGVREVLPFAMTPEPILRGFKNDGYFIWREGSAKKPVGTTQ